MCRQHEVWDQVRRIRRSKTRDRVPTRSGAITGDRGVGPIEARGDVEEVAGVAGRVRPERVQGGVDESEPAAVDLVGDGDQACPLRAAERGAADVKPAGAAGNS